MKKIIIICSLLISGLVGFSQSVVQRSNGLNTLNDPRWEATGNLFIPKYLDTTAANLNLGIDSSGAIFYSYLDQSLMIRKHNPKRWEQVGGSTGGGLSAVHSGYGLSNVDDSTLMADSTLLLTKLGAAATYQPIGNYVNVSDTATMLSPYLRKIDTASLSARINLKVNISDTASMLTPYLRKVDTTAMLSPYLRKIDTASLSSRIDLKVNISDTGSMLNPYLRKIDTASLSSRINLKQNILKPGADFTTNGDSLFLKGAWVNIKDFGAIDDNSTNNSAALAAAVATGKNVFIPPGGIFRYATGITLLHGQMIFGLGAHSQLKYTGTVRAIIFADSSKAANFHLIGNGKTSGNTFETGLFGFSAINWTAQDMLIENFGGAPQANGGGGIYCSAINGSNSAGASVINCRVLSCNGGIVFSERSEYINVTGCTVANSTVGIALGTGNFAVSGSIFEGNTTNAKIYSGTNNGHGVFSGCLFNHATQLLDIQDIAYSLGVQFSACDFYFGSLFFKNANNIRFSNCNMGTVDSVHIDNSYSLSDVNCSWGKTSLGNPIPFKLYNGAENFTTIGRARVDATTPIRWINQLHADTTWFNKLFFVDSLVAQTDTTTWKPAVYNPTTKQFQYSSAWYGGGISSITADNGLTASTSTNVQLGSTTNAGSKLLHDTYINTDTYKLIFNASGGNTLTLNSNKSIQLNGYGVNTFAGTPTYLLGVDASGNVVETPTGTTGTYLPTPTTVTNVAGYTVNDGTYWYRVGNVVTVSGEVQIDPTTTGATELDIDLPIASAFVNAYDLNGTGVSPVATAEPASFEADATNDRVAIKFVATSTANRTYHFVFTYLVK